MKSLILAFVLALGVSAHAEPAEIAVMGTGIVQTQPDHAVISLRITTLARTAQQANEENAKAKAELEKVVVGTLGMKATDLKTIGLTRGPVHEYVDGKTVLKGQGVTHVLSLKVSNLEDVARVWDVLSTVKVSSVDSISYDTSKRAELQRQAKRLAYADALANAKAYAAEAGLTDLYVQKISEESIGGRVPRFDAPMAARAESAGTSITTDDLTISATVNVLFSSKQ